MLLYVAPKITELKLRALILCAVKIKEKYDDE